MNDNRVEDEKNLTSALITALALLKEPPTKDVITAKATNLATIFGFEGNLEPIVNEAMIAVDSRMGAGVSLVDVAAEHDEEWVFKRMDIEWIYSDAYEKYLKTQRWHPTMVQSLSDVCTRILCHLQDPISEGSWSRRGLVIGHVQSGKTANYIGLVAKAADAGYKFIIVIAGIHNNLRKQTQERIDEGFIGRSSDPNNRVLAGVGLNGNYPHPATLTNIHEDFNKNTAEKSGWRINDFSKPIILVIKKHVRTLDALHKWLKELNTHRDGRISDVPMLLIDDEADNASINTNKPDLDPTRTNAMIRKILGLFAKSCYLGYTATPFANIFINPDAYDNEVYEELFPRDFIYCLDAPNTYFGPDKVFLDEATSSTIIEAITDCEEYIPWSHKKDDPIMELPPSLYRAIHQFVLARNIRNLRGHSGKHCSMMINVSRFVAVQKAVRDLISLYEKKMREAVKANYAMPEDISGRNQYMLKLREVFENDFTDCGFTWSQIKKSLWNVFDNLRIYVVNSKTDEALDYKRYENAGHSLTAIAIGGLSLSRGLTIEGLCVSYMYRNTRMYDTLMQMGRWFGYRPSYEDLCRVHLSADSINWYSHIADASEELRQQIKRMRRDGLSPRQFGLYVRAHPDSLLITASNKMRDAKRIVVKQNFSDRLVESHVLPTDDEVNRKNEELITQYWNNGFGGAVEKPTEKGWIFRDVNVQIIEEFLNGFHTHPAFVDSKLAVVSYLQALAEKHPLGDVLLISKNTDQAGRFRLGAQERSSRGWASDIWRLNKQRVASRGDEKHGLTPEQQELAEKEAGKKPSDRHFRAVRNKPLLMIHVLEPKELGDRRVPAFGVSFPPGHYGTEIEVVANRVWIEKMYGPLTDDPDAEEDFDE
jgi:hypothetical protein